MLGFDVLSVSKYLRLGVTNVDGLVLASSSKFLPLGAAKIVGLEAFCPLDDGITDAAPLALFEGTESMNRRGHSLSALNVWTPSVRFIPLGAARSEGRFSLVKGAFARAESTTFLLSFGMYCNGASPSSSSSSVFTRSPP